MSDMFCYQRQEAAHNKVVMGGRLTACVMHAKVLVEQFGIAKNGTVEEDLKLA